MAWQGYDNEGCMPGDRDRMIGRIDYSPDYKSEKREHKLAPLSGLLEDDPLRDEYLLALATSEDDAERSCLEREVISAARAWFRGAISETGLRAALLSLERFEKEATEHASSSSD